MSYTLQKGRFAGLTRKQAFLIGSLPSCIFIAAVMAIMGAFTGWNGTSLSAEVVGPGLPGMIVGIFVGVGFGVAAAAALGLLIWAVEDTKRMTLIHVVTAVGLLIAYGLGKLPALILFLYGGSILLQLLLDQWRRVRNGITK